MARTPECMWCEGPHEPDSEECPVEWKYTVIDTDRSRERRYTAYLDGNAIFEIASVVGG